MQKIDLTEIQAQIDSRQLKESKPSEQKQLNEEVVWNLWEVMAKLFPYQWTSREGDEPTEIWGQLLTELSQDQINQGLDRILKWTKEFPPTVLQFRQLCLPETISPDGKNSSAYLAFNDPKHPEYEPKRLESTEYVSKRKKAGNAALSGLHGMFGSSKDDESLVDADGSGMGEGDG